MAMSSALLRYVVLHARSLTDPNVAVNHVTLHMATVFCILQGLQVA